MAYLLPKEKLNIKTYKIQETEFDYVVPQNVSSISIRKEGGEDGSVFYYYYLVVNGYKFLYGMLHNNIEPMRLKSSELEIYKDMRTEMYNILNIAEGEVKYGVE